MLYEPDTGVLTWKVRGPGRTVGKPVGRPLPSGYMQAKINGEMHYVHRIAWLYVNGAWPDHQIDHIDGDKTNNAINNLRDCTAAQNSARRKTVRRVAPARGVFPHGKGFVARIHTGGKRHYLGYFKNLEEAKAAYAAKASKIHGEFAHVERLGNWDSEVADAVARSPHRDWLLAATPNFEGVAYG